MYRLIVLLLIAISCSPKEIPPAILQGDLSEMTARTITIENYAAGILDTLVTTERAIFNKSISIDEPILVNLKRGYSNFYVFLKPGEVVVLATSEEQKIQLKEPLSRENEVLRQLEEILPEISPQEYYALPYEDFVQKQEEYYAEVRDYIASLQKDDVDSKFSNLMELWVKAKVLDNNLTYPGYHEYLAKEAAKVPEGFPKITEGLEFDNQQLLHMEDLVGVLRSQIDNRISYEDYPVQGDYYRALLQEVEASSSGEIQEYLQATYLTNAINFSGGVDLLSKEIESFLADSENAVAVEKVRTVLAPWKNLRIGTPAPDFNGIDRKGERVTLEDLVGKNVYVDVWATWCGPCIREIPSLKEVEHDYSESNIEFVSVSIDNQDDKEKWIEFIVKEELGGTQLFAGNGWQSEIVSDYVIKGIPRFIMIDAEGKIISANAPRPSDPSLRDMLDKAMS